MKQIKLILVLAALGIASTSQAQILIQHTFDGGSGSLNGASLDTNTIGAGTWNAGLVTNYVDANGNVIGTNAASAWVNLNSAITMGSADDIFEVAFQVDHLGSNYDFEGGFWGLQTRPRQESISGKGEPHGGNGRIMGA
jgi:hypothetical protein